MYRRLGKCLATLYFVIWMVVVCLLWFSLEDFRAFSFFHKSTKHASRWKRHFKLHGNKSSPEIFSQATRGTIDVINRIRSLNTNGSHNQDGVRDEVALNLTKLQMEVNYNIGRLVKRMTAADLAYYNLSRPKTDHCNFEFLFNGSNICQDTTPFLVIIVPSAPHNVEKRMAIRETWGNYAKYMHNQTPYTSGNISLAFLLGRHINSTVKSRLLFESRAFKDIVLGDFQDTYKNLTRKVLMGLRWVTLFCSGAQYILKADDDEYVHIPRLVNMLNNHPADSAGYIYGKLFLRSPVMREGKWNISYKDYPMRFYPPYVSGGAYVISVNIAGKLLAVSRLMPYLMVEDVFITGILRFIISAYVEHRYEFISEQKEDSSPCEFISENRISTTVKNLSLLKEMWSVQQNPESCQTLQVHTTLT